MNGSVTCSSCEADSQLPAMLHLQKKGNIPLETVCNLPTSSAERRLRGSEGFGGTGKHGAAACDEVCSS